MSVDHNADVEPPCIYVWRSKGMPGRYALCRNREFEKLRHPDWRFLGDLESVAALSALNREAAASRTMNEWPFVVHDTGNGTVGFWPEEL
jgi:hypothetical protein